MWNQYKNHTNVFLIWFIDIFFYSKVLLQWLYHDSITHCTDSNTVELLACWWPSIVLLGNGTADAVNDNLLFTLILFLKLSNKDDPLSNLHDSLASAMPASWSLLRHWLADDTVRPLPISWLSKCNSKRLLFTDMNLQWVQENTISLASTGCSFKICL